jgi:MoaA/NifB/PqqE/SkfB family radical SAM enzyme
MGRFDFDKARDLIYSLKKKGYETTVFGGGEPFFWPHDLKSLIQYAKSLEFLTQVGTNATCLPIDFEDWNFVDRWVLPLDGVTDSTHNQMRFFQNRHRAIIVDTLNKLKQRQRTVTISTVLTQVNASEILKIAEFLKELNTELNQNTHFIHAWHLYQFIPQGRGGAKNQEQLLLPEQQYEYLVSAVKALALPFKIFKRKNMLFSETVEFFWMQQDQIYSQSRYHTARWIG